MNKLVLSAAVLAIVTGGMTAAVGFTAPPAASACAYQSPRSAELAAGLPRVNQGDKGRHVLALQLALRFEGYTQLRGTGTYATETLRAVKDFQRRNGIRDSGVVGAKTWQALVGKKPKSNTGGTLMSRTHVFSLRPGELNADKVGALFNLLQRIYPYAQDRALFESDDDFRFYNPTMQRMVRDFQKRAGITASGIVGPQTVTAMDEAVAVAGQWGC
jgi:peptidoglycan hydrolase-like protein with peptidoglycan-binding domain